MKIVTFNFSLKKKIILIFLIIIQISDIYLNKIIEEKEGKKYSHKQNKYNYFESYIITSFRNISYIFGIIIYLIYKFICKKYYYKDRINNKFTSISDNDILFSIKKVNLRYHFSKKYILNCFILTIIYIITFLFQVIKTKKFYPLYETSLILSLLSYIIFNKLFLSLKFERHHILSIIVICLLNIPIIIYFSLLYFYKNLYNITFYLFTGIYLGYFEYLIEIKFYNPYFLFFLESCFYLLLNLINVILYFKYKKKYIKNEIFNSYFIQINLLNLIYRLLFYIILFYFSSVHIILIELLSRSLIYISFYKILIYNCTKDDIIRIILAFLTFIFILIYIEIMEINFCHLNKNLKKNIIEREKNEKIMIN